MAFRSAASDLVSGDSNGAEDVFVRDVTAGATALVSANSAGTGAGNAQSDHPVISSDGRYVAFASNATNLVTAVSDTNNASDVFVRDLQTGTTSLVSVNTAATGTGAGTSTSPHVTPGGRYVAFQSTAGGLVPGIMSHLFNMYVRDRTAGSTSLVSVRDSNRPSVTPNGSSSLQDPSRPHNSVSADGRYVAYLSLADNIVPGDSYNTSDAFVRDMVAGTNILISVNSSGTGPGNSSSTYVVISANGRYVAFQSFASNLVAGDNNNASDVFVRDLQTGTTTLVSVNSAGTGSGNAGSSYPVISPDGRYVVFLSSATDLVPGYTNTNGGVFVRDLVAGTTRLVSVNKAGTGSGNGSSDYWQITPDGHYVAFDSYATDLVSGDTNGAKDVFVRDMVANTTTLVSVNSAGTSPGNLTSQYPVISDDGRYVAFESYASNLGPIDTNSTIDVYVRDLVAGTTSSAPRVSRLRSPAIIPLTIRSLAPTVVMLLSKAIRATSSAGITTIPGTCSSATWWPTPPRWSASPRPARGLPMASRLTPS